MARSAQMSNPGYGFVNRSLLTAMASQNTPGRSHDVRQPLLEGLNEFGLAGEIIFNVRLP